jgi:hypothetical protein
MRAYPGFGRRAQTRTDVQFATRTHHALLNQELERALANRKFNQKAFKLPDFEVVE